MPALKAGSLYNSRNTNNQEWIFCVRSVPCFSERKGVFSFKLRLEVKVASISCLGSPNIFVPRETICIFWF
jgi:hypothetical protein